MNPGDFTSISPVLILLLLFIRNQRLSKWTKRSLKQTTDHPAVTGRSMQAVCRQNKGKCSFKELFLNLMKKDCRNGSLKSLKTVQFSVSCAKIIWFSSFGPELSVLNIHIGSSGSVSPVFLFICELVCSSADRFPASRIWQEKGTDHAASGSWNWER